MIRPTLLAAGAASLIACGGDPEPIDAATSTTDTGTTSTTDTGTTSTTDTGVPSVLDTGTAPTDDAGSASAWALHSHPCVGNRTDALWVDADGTLIVGCGSTTTGLGLFVSRDGGASWAAPTTSPSNRFATWRVLDISRSADGLLYVAGIDTSSSARVLSADTSGATWSLALVYEAGSTVGTSFTVGTFRRTASGFAVAESLTGVDIQARTGDAEPWQDVSGWGSAHGGLQILDLEIHDGRFYGVGSTISNPPYLYRQNDETPFGLDVEQLATGLGAYDGEMWGVDVDASGIIAGGVDQDSDSGWVYAYDALEGGTLRTFEVRSVITDDPTWVRGVCRRGTALMAVGERSTRNRGFVFVSDDNGASWADVTPATDPATPFPPVHECVITAAGTRYVAGAGGLLAAYTP